MSGRFNIIKNETATEAIRLVRAIKIGIADGEHVLLPQGGVTIVQDTFLNFGVNVTLGAVKSMVVGRNSGFATVEMNTVVIDITTQPDASASGSLIMNLSLDTPSEIVLIDVKYELIFAPVNDQPTTRDSTFQVLALIMYTPDTAVYLKKNELDPATQLKLTQASDLVMNAGSPGGVAYLDSNGKIPHEFMPVSMLNILGSWSPATNTPTLSNSVGSTGDVYIVSTTANADIGSGSVAYTTGDMIIYVDGAWKILGNPLRLTGLEFVSTFATRSGHVVPNGSDYAAFYAPTDHIHTDYMSSTAQTFLDMNNNDIRHVRNLDIAAIRDVNANTRISFPTVDVTDTILSGSVNVESQLSIGGNCTVHGVLNLSQGITLPPFDTMKIATTTMAAGSVLTVGGKTTTQALQATDYAELSTIRTVNGIDAGVISGDGAFFYRVLGETLGLANVSDPENPLYYDVFELLSTTVSQPAPAPTTTLISCRVNLPLVLQSSAPSISTGSGANLALIAPITTVSGKMDIANDVSVIGDLTVTTGTVFGEGAKFTAGITSDGGVDVSSPYAAQPRSGEVHAMAVRTKVLSTSDITFDDSVHTPLIGFAADRVTIKKPLLLSDTMGTRNVATTVSWPADPLNWLPWGDDMSRGPVIGETTFPKIPASAIYDVTYMVTLVNGYVQPAKTVACAWKKDATANLFTLIAGANSIPPISKPRDLPNMERLYSDFTLNDNTFIGYYRNEYAIMVSGQAPLLLNIDEMEAKVAEFPSVCFTQFGARFYPANYVNATLNSSTRFAKDIGIGFSRRAKLFTANSRQYFINCESRKITALDGVTLAALTDLVYPLTTVDAAITFADQTELMNAITTETFIEIKSGSGTGPTIGTYDTHTREFANASIVYTPSDAVASTTVYDKYGIGVSGLQLINANLGSSYRSNVCGNVILSGLLAKPIKVYLQVTGVFA